MVMAAAVAAATMEPAATVESAAAMESAAAGARLLLEVRLPAAAMALKAAEAPLRLGVKTGPAGEAAAEAGKVLTPEATAGEAADAAPREEIAAQCGTEMAAAELPAAPAAMDPEFALAAKVAPEEGTIVPTAANKDRAVIDRLVIVIVGATVSGIAIAAGIGIVGPVSGLAVTRAGITLVIARVGSIALLGRIALLGPISLLRSITLLGRVALWGSITLLRPITLLRSIALLRPVALLRRVALFVTGPIILTLVISVLIGLRASGARQRAQRAEGDDRRFDLVSHGRLHLGAHEESLGFDGEDERPALNRI